MLDRASRDERALGARDGELDGHFRTHGQVRRKVDENAAGRHVVSRADVLTERRGRNADREVLLDAAGATTVVGAGCGSGETNSAGTYLGADYNEYSFTIDYRMNPGVTYQPGRYELFIKFCLVEK